MTQTDQTGVVLASQLYQRSGFAVPVWHTRTVGAWMLPHGARDGDAPQNQSSVQVCICRHMSLAYPPNVTVAFSSRESD
ncbi:unnamed protein product [Protopolystoma xenopodis]|uniref:Uncharacterized protein n=1 Tax=Protopolystoma xenopodis TaxID=117903 RepID=A0A3S5B3I2_9PLAT|nr:unnamed protein product [Protopolystoma xenopodis]